MEKEGKLYSALRRLWVWFSQREDRKTGADFATWETNGQTGIDPSRGNQYQPSTNGLGRVLKKLPVGNRDSIIDIGCGKGKAMYLMSRFPFLHVDGIELSGHLCKTAENNFKLLGLSKCNVMQADAAEFDGYGDYNYFYIFNALPKEVFRAALARIVRSIEEKPRKVYFIYLNPVCREDLEKSGVFRLLFRQKSPVKWFEYECYTNDA